MVEIAGTDLGNQGVEMTVRDQGPGIPPDELELVFDAFVQSSRTRDGSGGSGLGLAICRRIMAAHGGTIVAENAPGAGALLRMRLPAAQLHFASTLATADTAGGAPNEAPDETSNETSDETPHETPTETSAHTPAKTPANSAA